jgi:hypothetical protein
MNVSQCSTCGKEFTSSNYARSVCSERCQADCYYCGKPSGRWDGAHFCNDPECLYKAEGLSDKQIKVRRFGRKVGMVAAFFFVILLFFPHAVMLAVKVLAWFFTMLDDFLWRGV